MRELQKRAGRKGREGKGRKERVGRRGREGKRGDITGWVGGGGKTGSYQSC